MDDEKLQKKIEAGDLNLESGIDADAYRTVFNALKTNPDGQLKNSLADKVIQKLIAAKERREYRKDMFWFFAALLALVAGMVLCVGFILPYLKLDNVSHGLSGLIQYKGLILVTVIMLGVFSWLDKKLLKQPQSEV
jgi:hypothetical protein